ncbi:uncharacterized protein FIBRA_03876 [Fibroporia radiculosa]|uniref:PX domain-containing protein n=1 Tax=Fibroporia radiculosa TaxID=599839 RepID=J4G6H1_9APHY|nr:uncharacterized protein FIBRA_03876 [Fibroporia radiculosa]CCM01808.1 predicted protein [Fibroporia radiculosa]
MDGFDDLLSRSQNVLDNPFENPFSKQRSSSPDPWASYGQPSAFQEDVQPAFLGARSTTPTLDIQPFGESAGFEYSAPEPEPTHVSDQIAVAEAKTEVQPEPEHEVAEPTSPVSPGFRVSIAEEEPQPADFQPEATPSPITPQSPTSPVYPATAPATSGKFAPFPGHASRPSNASNSSSLQPVYKAEPAFHSPLDPPATAGIERSIAGLSIGGETFNGWQGSQSAFVGVPQSAGVTRSRNDSDSSDDDRPILQSAKLSANRLPQVVRPASAPRTETGLQPVFMITVDDPQKVGDPIRAYTMYTVHTKTTSPLYSKSSFSVLRRYSDFLWLYETLSQNNPGVVVPPVPEKNPYRRFDENFVQQRRFALEKCIQKIANHPVLQKDSDLKMFLESDSFALDIKQRKAELAHEKGGLMATIGHSLAGPRYYETDEWFDRQKAYLDSLESQLRGLVKSIDLVAKHRSELSAATGEFAQVLTELSASDLGDQLSGLFSGLAEVERKAQELQSTQSREDVVTIMGTVDEYSRLISSVRLAFSSRIRTYHNWQSADGHVRRVKQTHETNRAQGRIPSDQLSRSLSIIAEAERRALDAKQEFDQVSRLVKSEVARFEQERIEDFKNSLEAFLDGMISRQKELIATWESYQQRLLMVAAPQNPRPAVDSSATSTVSS